MYLNKASIFTKSLISGVLILLSFHCNSQDYSISINPGLTHIVDLENNLKIPDQNGYTFTSRNIKKSNASLAVQLIVEKKITNRFSLGILTSFTALSLASYGRIYSDQINPESNESFFYLSKNIYLPGLGPQAKIHHSINEKNRVSLSTSFLIEAIYTDYKFAKTRQGLDINLKETGLSKSLKINQYFSTSYARKLGKLFDLVVGANAIVSFSNYSTFSKFKPIRIGGVVGLQYRMQSQKTKNKKRR